MLDELLLGGEIQETSKKNVLKAIAAQDLLQEVSKQEEASNILGYLYIALGTTGCSSKTAVTFDYQKYKCTVTKKYSYH